MSESERVIQRESDSERVSQRESGSEREWVRESGSEREWVRVRQRGVSRRPWPGGMAAHWCLMSRAQAVWSTGSTKMSALLSFSMFSTSCRRQEVCKRGSGGVP